VFERNPPGVTFGWGVVFSDQTVENLTANDPRRRRSSPTSSRIGTTSTSISAASASPRAATASSASAASACSKSCRTAPRARRRPALRSRVRSRRSQSGATTTSSSPRTAPTRASATRRPTRSGSTSTCAPTSSSGSARQGVRRLHLRVRGDRARLDLGARLPLRARLLDLHRRMFGRDLARLRLRPDGPGEAIAACEKLFAKYLDGHALQSNAAHLVGSAAWLNFRRIKCERWNERQRHPARRRRAHRAFLDRLGHQARARGCDQAGRGAQPPASSSLEAALDEYEAERNLEVLKLQNSARNSTEWFETLERYLHFEPLQFAYSLLTRSQRISHENLRLRDREWLEGVERWFWKRATAGRSNKTAPPMFAPFKLREMEVENRITVSPMAMYSAVDGTPNDFHFVHLRRARAGRRRPGVHRDDLRLARGPDQPRLHRHVERRACRRVEADRRFRPRQPRRRSASSSAIRAPRARPNRLGRQ
jgi:hypothetical protein